MQNSFWEGGSVNKGKRLERLIAKGIAKQLIEDGGSTAPCWICWRVFKRVTETARWCYRCGRGFCEGIHGTFSRGAAHCIVCGVTARDR